MDLGKDAHNSVNSVRSGSVILALQAKVYQVHCKGLRLPYLFISFLVFFLAPLLYRIRLCRSLVVLQGD